MIRDPLRVRIERELKRRRDPPGFLRDELAAAARQIVRFHRGRGLRAGLSDNARVLTLHLGRGRDGERVAVVSVHEEAGRIRCERRVRDDAGDEQKDPRVRESVFFDDADQILDWYVDVVTNLDGLL